MEPGRFSKIFNSWSDVVFVIMCAVLVDSLVFLVTAFIFWFYRWPNIQFTTELHFSYKTNCTMQYIKRIDISIKQMQTDIEKSWRVLWVERVESSEHKGYFNLKCKLRAFLYNRIQVNVSIRSITIRQTGRQTGFVIVTFHFPASVWFHR